MKVYQTIHKYLPYIPYFERKYGDVINDLSFNELRNLLITDGYASCYILQPAIEGRHEEVFYTIWDYEKLQQKWAVENGLRTKSLDEIKLAQIEQFKPDVFYNHSPYYDGNFIEHLQEKKDLKKFCWDAIISYRPSFHENYDLRLTLYEPYVKYWNQHGFNSVLLPPAFPDSWDQLNMYNKDIDVLFYGQYSNYFFSKRNSMLKELVKWSKIKGLRFQLHLQDFEKRKPLINVRGIRRYTSWIPATSKHFREIVLPPIYGQMLYETISKSKIVVNSFTNYNGLYKDNMRNYESIGCGAFLISEDGIYPEHFIPNKDFYTYSSVKNLFERIEHVLSLPDEGFNLVQKTRIKLKSIYSKEKQWASFIHAFNSLKDQP